MSVNYTVFIHDDFDWDYEKTNKEEYMIKLKKDLMEATPEGRELPKILANFRHWVVYDFDRQSPEFGEINKLLMDQDLVYFNTCHDAKLIRLTKQKV